MNESVYVSDATFEGEVLESKIPVLVDFYAEWCGSCRAIHLELDDIAHRVHGEFAVMTLNIEENRATAYRYGVSTIPAIILFKNGRPVERFSGIVSKQTVISRFQSHMPSMGVSVN